MKSRNENDLTIDTRLRILRVIWFALFVSIGLYYGLTLFVGQSPTAIVGPTGIVFDPLGFRTRAFISISLAATGLFVVAISLLLKKKYLSQSVREQRVSQAHIGYILAWALCEVPAILALIDFFITRNRYYFVGFIIATGGDLLNFPRRQHLLDASFKPTL